MSLKFERGPVHLLPTDFSVLEFSPTEIRKCWTYATCGMSSPMEETPIEFFILSPTQMRDQFLELLYAAAHYHINTAAVNLWHTVNFGRPWFPGSKCSFGYVMGAGGPPVEWAQIDDERIRFLWLIPITELERDYKAEHGHEAFEALLKERGIDFTDPSRRCCLRNEK